MTSLRRAAAQSVSEFVSFVDQMRTVTASGLWFRGHADCRWMLAPSALRALSPITDGRGNPVKSTAALWSGGGQVTGLNPERMLHLFKQRSRPFLRELPANDFEWMFLAQHHGLPTRLLDWSTNALVALFFALERAPTTELDGQDACDAFMAGDGSADDQGCAVFVVDPGQLNDAFGHPRAPINISERLEDWRRYVDPVGTGDAYFPVCINAPYASERIRAQSGAFTLHGSNTWAIDYYSALQDKITKIFIPYSAVAQMRVGLRRLGMTRSFIYADLDSVAADVAAFEQDVLARALEQQDAEFDEGNDGL